MRLPRALTYRCFGLYYRLKIALLKPIVGPEAIAIVLYQSWFPHLVLKIGGATLGRHTRIQRRLTVHESGGSFANLRIGDDVFIGKDALIDLTGRVTIGDRVGIGMAARLFTHQNIGDSRLVSRYPAEKGDLTIPADSVISTAALVLYPAQLAAGTVVSAGSVVRGTYSKPCVLIGNPARVVADLSADLAGPGQGGPGSPEASAQTKASVP